LFVKKNKIADSLHDLIFYTAQDHPGGRISSAFLNGGWIETGAQWIHGQNNDVWKIAHKYDLLSTVTSSEGQGKTLKDRNILFSNETLGYV
jgi:monoamine oxidase